MTPDTSAYDTSAYELVRRDLLGRIDRDGLDPAADEPALRGAAEEAVRRYQRRAHLGQAPVLHDPEATVARLLRAVTGFGSLTDLLGRADVEEVFIEGARVSYIDRSGRVRALAAPTTEEENRQVVERLLAPTPRRLDAASPLVQARVLDGRARLTAAIPPVAETLSATIRRQTLRRESLRAMVEANVLDEAAAAFLWGMAQGPVRLLVSGAPGAGKTSLLNALLAAVPGDRCVRCCEEIRELSPPLTHGAFYETRPPGMDGRGEVSLRDLVKFTLAMRPDVIVVGEVRGAEAFELTRAVNAGCGLACTIHANSAADALEALVHAAVMAGENVGEQALRAVFATGIDVVVHLELRQPDRGQSSIRRRVTEILAVVPSLHGGFSTEPVFARERFDQPLRWTGYLPPEQPRFDSRLPAGLSLRALATQGGLPC